MHDVSQPESVTFITGGNTNANNNGLSTSFIDYKYYDNL